MRRAASGCSSSTSEIARAMARASPARTPSASEWSGGKELSGDDEPLDLARAFADGRELDVAEILLGGVILDKPVPAMDLDAVFCRAHGDFAGVELGHGGFEGRPLPLVLHRGGAIRQQP